jgi:WD40 repeat protein
MSLKDDVLQFPARINALAWSPDSLSIAAACSDGSVYVRNIDSPVDVRPMRLYGHYGEALSVTWSPDGKRIASGGADHRVQMWNAETGMKIGAALDFDDEVSKVQWAPIGRRFLVVSGRRVWVAKEEVPKQAPRLSSARAWRMRGEQTARLRLIALDHDQLVTDAEWDPSGEFVATASVNLTIEIWDAVDEEWTLSLAEETGVVRLKWAPDGLLVAAGTSQGTVCVYQPTGGRLMERYRLANAPVKDLSWIEDRESRQKVVGAQGRRTSLGEPHGTSTFAFSPDGRFLATGSRNRAVRIYSQEEINMP